MEITVAGQNGFLQSRFRILNLRERPSSSIRNLDGTSLASSATVRNLRVIFDQNLSFGAHIKQVSKIAF